MIPPTPTSLTTMPASKTKIGFSIDSIVGEDVIRSPKDVKSDFKYTNDYQTEIARALRISDSISNDAQKIRSDIENRGSQQRNVSNLFEYSSVQRERSNSPSHNQSNFPSEESVIRRSRSPSPHRSDTNQFMNLHAGPIRPLPIVPQNLIESKTIPPYINLPGLPQVHNSQYMQAQFQMAAALAQRQAEHGFPASAKFGSHPPHLVNPNMAREYPLYPWLLSRHGRIFPHGFPGNFLLHPFRKPKRVRTAFSPSQLLKLEHAFESNQYVVGAERKALAQALNLSETQVKVWFQNRRTKHKRMQQEEDSKGGNGNNNSTNNDGSIQSYHEDEMIDMEDCFSEDDSDSQH